MLIYKIVSDSTDEVYVGKTTHTLNKRLRDHEYDYKYWLAGIGLFRSSFHILEYDDYRIELIELTHNSLREIFWIQRLNCCNYEFNSTNYFITTVKDSNCKNGIIYDFHVKRGTKKNMKSIIRKTSTNIEYLRKFRNNWLKNNSHYFK